MSLSDWVNNGWLQRHSTSPEEIRDLLDIIERDLQECRIHGLSADWQLSIAYNAALKCATAALAATGYRVSREASHYRTIQSLTFTIKIERETVDLLDTFRNKRNITDYDRAGTISQQEANEIYTLANNLRNQLGSWLQSNHPHLIR